MFSNDTNETVKERGETFVVNILCIFFWELFQAKAADHLPADLPLTSFYLSLPIKQKMTWQIPNPPVARRYFKTLSDHCLTPSSRLYRVHAFFFRWFLLSPCWERSASVMTLCTNFTGVRAVRKKKVELVTRKALLHFTDMPQCGCLSTDSVVLL